MKNWLKSRFRKDRWMILRLSHWQYGNRPGVRETKLHCKNRYSGKLATFSLDGEFYIDDFANRTFRK